MSVTALKGGDGLAVIASKGGDDLGGELKSPSLSVIDPRGSIFCCLSSSSFLSEVICKYRYITTVDSAYYDHG